MGLKIPSKYKEALKTIQDAGYEVYLVGGCVRDHLLSLPIKDYDFVTTATPEQGIKLFPNAVALAQKFGVLRVPMGSGEFLDLATARKDGPYSDLRRPDFVSYASVREDLQRRDFTVNALLYDPIKDEVVDLVGGLEDLKQKQLNAVGSAEERFKEDPLRMWRGVRFQVKLGFTLSSEAVEAIKNHVQLSQTPSKERITEELRQSLEKDSLKTLSLLREYGLDSLFFKEKPKSVTTTLSFSQCLLYLSQQESDVEIFGRKMLILSSKEKEKLAKMKQQLKGLKSFSSLSLEEKNRLKYSSGIEEVLEYVKNYEGVSLDFNYLSSLTKEKLSALLPTAKEVMGLGFVGKDISLVLKQVEQAVYAEKVQSMQEKDHMLKSISLK